MIITTMKTLGHRIYNKFKVLTKDREETVHQTSGSISDQITKCHKRRVILVAP